MERDARQARTELERVASDRSQWQDILTLLVSQIPYTDDDSDDYVSLSYKLTLTNNVLILFPTELMCRSVSKSSFKLIWDYSKTSRSDAKPNQIPLDHACFPTPGADHVFLSNHISQSQSRPQSHVPLHQLHG